MPKKPRPLERTGEATRDATLIVVASEDTYAADHYFKRFRAKRVQFKVLPTLDGKSAPEYVLARLDEFRQGWDTEEGDTFWLCIDRDRWHELPLMEVLRECLSRGYNIAISNPCFDLWILLHHEDLALQEPIKCNDLVARISAIIGSGYGKKCCSSMKFTSEMISQAMERAKKLDDEELLSTKPLTKVYKIIELLLSRDRLIVIHDPVA
jgi:hypothetical protein